MPLFIVFNFDHKTIVTSPARTLSILHHAIQAFTLAKVMEYVLLVPMAFTLTAKEWKVVWNVQKDFRAL